MLRGNHFGAIAEANILFCVLQGSANQQQGTQMAQLDWLLCEFRPIACKVALQLNSSASQVAFPVQCC